MAMAIEEDSANLSQKWEAFLQRSTSGEQSTENEDTEDSSPPDSLSRSKVCRFDIAIY